MFSPDTRFKFVDALDTIESLVKVWTPGDRCSSEKAYELSLYEFLHAQLPRTQVTKQWSHGRGIVDIVVGEKVAVELKYNLEELAELHRLVGQLHQYKGWGLRGVIVALTGRTDLNLRKDLEKAIAELNGFSFTLFDEPRRFRLIVK